MFAKAVTAHFQNDVFVSPTEEIKLTSDGFRPLCTCQRLQTGNSTAGEREEQELRDSAVRRKFCINNLEIYLIRPAAGPLNEFSQDGMMRRKYTKLILTVDK